jgi:uncharacterized protein (TIGR02453 family)
MTNDAFSEFQPSLVHFLSQLSRNNNRIWFQKNKARYEQDVLEPSLAFIRAFAPHLKKVSGYFVANDSRVGGSLMRIYRDTRFAKDKTPYKTNVGIQFRHEMGKDVHAPGFYVHIAPDECFLGIGLWCPATEALTKIRNAIVEEPAKWKRARDNKKFREHFELTGERLKSAPRGFDKEHALIEDLKFKSFCGTTSLSEEDVLSDTFMDDVANSFVASRPLMRFLCEALHIPF